MRVYDAKDVTVRFTTKDGREYDFDASAISVERAAGTTKIKLDPVVFEWAHGSPYTTKAVVPERPKRRYWRGDGRKATKG